MSLRTIDYLMSDELAALYWPGVLTGLLIALMCARLSVLVVLKRMSFIGQGISHAAFGGIGLAAVAGVLGKVTVGASVGQFFFVLGTCLAAALLMAWISRRGDTESDTAIGIVLVGAMALGAVLLRVSKDPVQWESFLFGDMLSVGWGDFALAGVITTIVFTSLWWWRRPLLFQAFDEPSATAWGVNVRGMQFLLMLLLALVTVTAMKLAGVVLATAMLVLPGATALKLASTWTRVAWVGIGIALFGVVAGVVLSFEADWPPGPAIVLVLTASFAGAAGFARLRKSHQKN